MTTLQRGLTREQRQRLWQMWKTGSSITDIGISLSKAPGSVHTYLSHQGGIAPPSRQRADRHLSLAQREEISRGLVLGSSLRSIALLIGVAPSTVTREVKRNGGGSAYRAVTADARATAQACRPKACKLACHVPLREAVANKLQQDWSPQQVSGWLRKFHGDDSKMQLSHEAIYRSLFIQTRGLLKRELLAHLRSRRMMRRAKPSVRRGDPEGKSLMRYLYMSVQQASKIVRFLGTGRVT